MFSLLFIRTPYEVEVVHSLILTDPSTPPLLALYLSLSFICFRQSVIVLNERTISYSEFFFLENKKIHTSFQPSLHNDSVPLLLGTNGNNTPFLWTGPSSCLHYLHSLAPPIPPPPHPIL